MQLTDICLRDEDGSIVNAPLLLGLTSALLNHELILGKHTTGDWLARLSVAELNSLHEQCRLSDIEDTKGAEVVGCILHLFMLETGNKPRYEIEIDAIIDYLDTLGQLAVIEHLRRKNLLKIQGKLMLTDLRQAKVQIGAAA